jgi:hypothetical protein
VVQTLQPTQVQAQSQANGNSSENVIDNLQAFTGQRFDDPFLRHPQQ